MSKLPTAQDVFTRILAAAKRQIETTSEGKAFIAAGMREQLDSLLVQIAGNVSQPIAADYEDAIGDEP